MEVFSFHISCRVDRWVRRLSWLAVTGVFKGKWITGLHSFSGTSYGNPLVDTFNFSVPEFRFNTLILFSFFNLPLKNIIVFKFKKTHHQVF